MSHTRAETAAYKKASPGTTIGVTDGTVLPVEGFGAIKMDLDQLSTTTKPVKRVAVTYVPGLSRDLLSPCKAMDQWGKPLIYYKTKAFWGFPEEESLVLNSFRRVELCSAAGVRRTSNQEAVLALAAKTAEAMIIATTGQWRLCEARLQAEAK